MKLTVPFPSLSPPIIFQCMRRDGTHFMGLVHIRSVFTSAGAGYGFSVVELADQSRKVPAPSHYLSVNLREDEREQHQQPAVIDRSMHDGPEPSLIDRSVHGTMDPSGMDRSVHGGPQASLIDRSIHDGSQVALIDRSMHDGSEVSLIDRSIHGAPEPSVIDTSIHGRQQPSIIDTSIHGTQSAPCGDDSSCYPYRVDKAAASTSSSSSASPSSSSVRAETLKSCHPTNSHPMELWSDDSGSEDWPYSHDREDLFEFDMSSDSDGSDNFADALASL